MSPNRKTFALASLIVAAALVWLAFAGMFAPTVIDDAYHGRSIAPLNRVISGQLTHPQEHYQQIWAGVARLVLVAILTGGLALIVMTRPETERFLFAQMPPPSLGSEPRIEPRGRRALVNTLIGAVLLVQFACIGLHREFWPWSDYPMYSGLEGPKKAFTLLVGVARDREIPLYEGKYWQPFDNARVSTALESMADDRRRRAALTYLAALYETNRRAGRHDGPLLNALRLYELEWRLEPMARNKDRPDRRSLLAEVPAGYGGER